MASIIGVETLQHTNGTDAITIDSNGHVSMPKVYLCSAAWDGSSTADKSSKKVYTAYETSDHTLASGQHKAIYRDDYSMLNASTGVVTIPADGVWIIAGHYADGTGSAIRRIGQIWVNDASYGEWCESYGQYDDTNGIRILKLSSGDEIMFGHNGSFPFDDFAFEMTRIG